MQTNTAAVAIGFSMFSLPADEVGDMIYWPCAHLAIYCRHDGQPIPSQGIIMIAKIDSGADALNVPGPSEGEDRTHRKPRMKTRNDMVEDKHQLS
jgi:hypothetical protein